MGGSESSNSAKHAKYLAQYGGIYIKPDKDRYSPGEQFNGFIYLNLLKSYPGDSLYVIVKGVEKYMHSYTSTNNDNNSTDYHVAKDKLVFVNKYIPVYKVSGRDFQPGQYAFPISFLIPPGTPPSFYQEGNDWVASIEFKVKAVLGTFDSQAPKLRYKENILIVNNKNLEGIPKQSQRNFELMVCCCCCGETSISFGLEKNALIPGETTNLGFFVDNSKGGLDFSSVRCELIEKIVLGNNRYVFKNNVVALNLQGIESKGNSRGQEVQITLPPYKPENIKSKRIPYKRYRYDDVHKMKYAKNELVPTTRAKLVNIQFFLAVELINNEWNACCCYSNPIVEIPVQIYIPSFTLENNIQAPQDWNPKLMSSSNFALDVAPTMNYYEGVDPDSRNQARQGKQDTEILTQKMGMDDNFMKPHKNFDDYNFKENVKGAEYHKF